MICEVLTVVVVARCRWVFYRRFGTTCRSHLQVSSSPRNIARSCLGLDPCRWVVLKLQEHQHQPAPFNIPGERSQLHCGGSLKSRRCCVNPTFNVGLKFGSSTFNSQALQSAILPPVFQVTHKAATVGSPPLDEYFCPCLQLR